MNQMLTGFGPPQAVSTEHSFNRISIHSLKSSTQHGFVDGSFRSRLVATTTIPKLPSHSSGDMRNSIPVPVLTHAPLSAVRFIGPLNFVQPDQPFLVGCLITIHINIVLSALRSKYFNTTLLLSENGSVDLLLL
uniref:Ovule protein n=1 Tax=Ascaris lumbricoides TaxID=6252 RepID=A0A0M3HQ95_ASCLU